MSATGLKNFLPIVFLLSFVFKILKVIRGAFMVNFDNDSIIKKNKSISRLIIIPNAVKSLTEFVKILN